MSADFPNRKVWLAIRHTPRNLWKNLGRLIFSGGTYVRARADPKENARLQWFANQCNANRARKRS